MSKDDFYKWLRLRGVSEKDCKTLSGKIQLRCHYNYNSIAITPPIVNCHRGIEVLWPKYHGLIKQGLILHSLAK